MTIRPSSKQVRENIYTDIPQQFPAIYRDSGPLFVEFVKQYYKYIDSRQNDFRDAFVVRDVDTTYERFLIHFRNKYLADLPLESETDLRFVIKHIQDLYRRKGTKEGLELFFRIFFNEEVEIKYPSLSILKPSDSRYGTDNYLELNPVDTFKDYFIRRGDRIVGDTSLAEAFIDEIIFQNINGLIVPTAYLSNLVGRFNIDDSITVIGTRDGVETTTPVGEIIYGSISNVSIRNAKRSPGNSVGDTIDIVSRRTGIKGKGRVSEIERAETSVIEFAVEDSGWGYSLDVNKNIVKSSTSTLAFSPFDNETFTGGYPGNGAATSFPKVGDYFISDNTLSAGAGRAGANIASSDLSGDTNFAYGEVVDIDENNGLIYLYYSGSNYTLNTSNSSLYEISTVVSEGFDVYFYDKPYLIDSDNLLFVFGEYVANTASVGQMQYFFEEAIPGEIDGIGNVRKRFDLNGDGVIDATDEQFLDDYFNAELTDGQARVWIKEHVVDYLLSNIDRIVSGRLRDGDTIEAFDWYYTGNTSLASNDIIDTDNPHDNAGAGYPITGYITSSSPYNDSATYRIGSIKNTETISVIPDVIGDYLDVELVDQNFPSDPSLTNYGMSGLGFENINTTLADAFFPTTFTIGEIDTIIVTNNGENYQSDVRSTITQPDVASYDKKDQGIIFTNPQFIIEAGDIVEQTIQIEDFLNSQVSDYTVRARFLRRVGDVYYFRPISFYTFEKQYPIRFKGNEFEIQQIIPDANSLSMGNNAIIGGTAQFAQGQISKAIAIDTGFRYTDGEIVDLVSTTETRRVTNAISGEIETVPNQNFNQIVAQANIEVRGTGFAESGWRTTTSFLNDPTKVIHDNFYYQEYSFDISSIVPEEDYFEIVSDLMQPAGTKQFASPLINSVNFVNAELDVTFEVYDLTVENLLAEPANVAIEVEEANVAIGELAAVIVELNEELSNTVTEDINN